MISVSKELRYSNQDFDEQQAILRDLRENPRDYLAHADGMVRSLADWCMEDFGIRRLRIGTYKPDKSAGERQLIRLYKRLRELS